MPENLEELAERFSSLAGQKQFSMPPTEVIENGQRVANPRMDPSVMSFVMQAAMASQLVKIRKYFDDRTSKGHIQSLIINATDQLQEAQVTYTAQSFSLHNDGPNPVNVGVNNPAMIRAPINMNEDLVVDFETHKLKWLYLQCARGETATVRIIAEG